MTDEGLPIRSVQALLNARLGGSPLLAVDGVMSSATVSALRDLQRARRIPVTGEVDALTARALMNGKDRRPERSHAVHPAPWMDVAAAEIGVTEIAGQAHEPRILAYHATTRERHVTDEMAWCSAFVNWCLRQANYTGANSAAANSWVHWAQGDDLKCLRYGAVTVIRNEEDPPGRGYHVGFYLETVGIRMRLLGGNQRNIEVCALGFPKFVPDSRRSPKGYSVVAIKWPRGELSIQEVTTC